MLTADDLHTGKRSCLLKDSDSSTVDRDQPQRKPSRQCSLGTVRLKRDYLELEDDDGNLTRVCLPIKADAYVRGDTEPKVLVLLKFRDDRGTMHVLPVTKSECMDGKALLARLVNCGWHWYEPKKVVLRILDELLTWCSPENNLQRVENPGWHRNGSSENKAFIFGDQVFAPKGEKPAVYYCGAVPFKSQGTVQEWRQSVAKLFSGNTRQILLLSAAFSGPLLGLLKLPNIGIHLHGPSRSGKTVTLKAICSVFGGEEIMGSWKATANALLQSAVARNDLVLALDELSQAKAADASEAVYDLMNGYTKGRLNSDSKIQKIKEFNLVAISTGEQSFGAYLATHNLPISAGQSARMLSIPFSPHGVFENVHGYKNHATLAGVLAVNAQKYYGTAGPAFIRYLVEHQDDIEQDAAGRIEKIQDDLTSGLADPQETGFQLDVALRFAIIAYAGELAIEAGILPFDERVAISAVRTCFKAWNRQYKAEAATRDPVFAAVKGYIADHQASFVPLAKHCSTNGQPIGFTRDVDGVTAYLLTQTVFQQKLCLQHGKSAVIAALKNRNLLMLGARGTPTRQIAIPGLKGGKQSFYVINSLILSTV